MIVLLRVAGVVLAILALTALRKERDDASTDRRPVRRGWISLCAAVAVAGLAVALWAIFAS